MELGAVHMNEGGPQGPQMRHENPKKKRGACPGNDISKKRHHNPRFEDEYRCCRRSHSETEVLH